MEVSALAEAKRRLLRHCKNGKLTVLQHLVSSVIGVPVGARTVNYDIDKIKVAIAQMNAQTSAKTHRQVLSGVNRQKFQYQQAGIEAEEKRISQYSVRMISTKQLKMKMQQINMVNYTRIMQSSVMY